MSPLKQQVSVFLIYSHMDKEVVHKLYQRLSKDGIPAWLDSKDLQPGQNWEHEIRKAIFKSDVAIVCLSREFNKQKGYRHEELKLALEKTELLDEDKVFIIPVRLEKCEMPGALQRLHRVDLFEAGGYKKLIRALRKLKDSSQ